MRRDPVWLHWAIGSARSWRDIESLVPETGIDIVDSDHRGLLEYIVSLNLLAEDSRAGLDADLLVKQRSILDGLLEYTKQHFAREERLIAMLGAPNLERQEREHERITEAVRERVADFAAGRLTVSPELRRSVFGWIVDHISGTDYETFKLTSLVETFSRTKSWEDIRYIIRSTGVDHLDEQHRALVDAILAAARALRDCAEATGASGKAEACGEKSPGELRDLVATAFGEMVGVCRRHFADEEAFMLRFGLRGQEAQRTSHALFLARVECIADEAAQDSFDVEGSRTLARELIVWIADHVNNLDHESFHQDDWLTRALESRPPEELRALVRSTGNAKVDSDHLEFLERASDFCALLREGAGPAEALAASFDGLVGYAARHFSDEESLFPASAMSRVSRHRDEHAIILKTLKEYRSRLAEGRIGAASAVKGAVLGWWVHHTNGMDIDTFGSAAMGGPSHVA